MYCARHIWCDGQPAEHWGELSEWLQVEGDLDDFIFYDPFGLPPDPEWAK